MQTHTHLPSQYAFYTISNVKMDFSQVRNHIHIYTEHLW